MNFNHWIFRCCCFFVAFSKWIYWHENVIWISRYLFCEYLTMFTWFELRFSLFLASIGWIGFHWLALAFFCRFLLAFPGLLWFCFIEGDQCQQGKKHKPPGYSRTISFGFIQRSRWQTRYFVAVSCFKARREYSKNAFYVAVT